MSSSESFPERCQLAAGLEISRIVTGLWQVADMERDGSPLDLGRAAASRKIANSGSNLPKANNTSAPGDWGACVEGKLVLPR